MLDNLVLALQIVSFWSNIVNQFKIVFFCANIWSSTLISSYAENNFLFFGSVKNNVI